MGKYQREKRAPRSMSFKANIASLTISDYSCDINGKDIKSLIKEAIPQHPGESWAEDIPVRVTILIEELMEIVEEVSGHDFPTPEPAIVEEETE